MEEKGEAVWWAQAEASLGRRIWGGAWGGSPCAGLDSAVVPPIGGSFLQSHSASPPRTAEASAVGRRCLSHRLLSPNPSVPAPRPQPLSLPLPPRGMARRGEVRQARCRGSARPADLRGRKMGHSFSLQALQLGVDVGQSSLGQSQPLREGRREEDPVVQAPSPLQSGDTGLGPLEPTSSPRTPKSCPQPPPPPPSSLARIPNLLKGVGDGLVAEEIIVQDV